MHSKSSSSRPESSRQSDRPKSERRSRRKHQEDGKTTEGVLSYKLSDNSYIEKGWTKLPERDVDPRIEPWLCFKKKRMTQYYVSGKLALNINEDGTGAVFYRDGKPAIRLIDSISRGQEILLYGYKDNSESAFNGQKKDLPIGRFDSFGNCVVYDEEGKVLVTYDRQGGVLYINDTEFYRWEWCPSKGTRNQRKNQQKTVKSIVDRFSDYGKDPKILTSSVSAELLTKSLLSRSHVHQLKTANRGQDKRLHCRINDFIALWIYSRQKIQLSFACDDFKYRCEVGVDIH